MTQALCFNCGEIKVGALLRCPGCQAKPTGNRDLDILFSDWKFAVSTLEELGKVIQQIRPACDDDAERFWIFLKYCSDNYPEVLTIELPEQFTESIPALLATLNLPKIKLKLASEPSMG